MSFRSEKEEDKSVNKEQTLAIGACKLLRMWKIPPGIDDEGNFNIDQFKSWFQTVKDISDKTGHIKVSMMTFGNVLMHIPPDEDGLWINKEVARILNDKRSDELRRGLYLGYVNSVGVYTPGNGFEERKAKEYRDRAQSAEEHGYRRLANCMKDVEEYFISLKKESDLHN
jgi:3',5'-cyclic AMP phosphodiesterase CpdA